jgi:hypothetical protein
LRFVLRSFSKRRATVGVDVAKVQVVMSRTNRYANVAGDRRT